jgi:biotin carboxylase
MTTPIRGDSNSRVALVVASGSYRVSAFLAAADKCGVELTIATDAELPLIKSIAIDLSESRSSAAAIAAAGPFTSVIAPDDVGVAIAAEAAALLGLAQNPPLSVALTRNKAMMRDALTGVVPQPRSWVVERGADVGAIIAEFGAPCVIKPVSRSGSQGVILINDPNAAEAVIERVRRILAMTGGNPNEALLLEEYIDGEEVAVEGVVENGRFRLLAIFDKPDPLNGPYFEETLYVTPSRHHPEVLAELERTTSVICETLGLVSGPVHAEFRIASGRVVVLEVAARSIGGQCGQALSFSGLTLEEILIMNSLGRPLPLPPPSRASGILMLPIPKSGHLVSVQGVEEASTVSGVTGVEISIAAGSRVVPLPEGNRYLGFVFASGRDPGEVEASLRSAGDLITFDIRPDTNAD